jgi:hypothetical protein
MGRHAGSMPGAPEMRAYVAEFVRRLTVRKRIPLDYSVSSLRIVDVVVDGMREGGAERERVAGTLFGLGCYLGEVLVRRAGAVWVECDASQRELFGQPVAVRMPDGRVWNPLGKVVNRFEYGRAESAQQMFLTLHGRNRPLPAA